MPSNVLRFDFSSFQESGSLDGFEFEFYKDGILTINPAIEGNMIYAVEIVGAFKHADKNGKIIEQPIENLSIRFADYWERDIVLTIRDLAFQAKDQLSAIQATGNLNLNVFGENLMIGKDAIRCGDLTLMGENEAVLTVKGFSGGVGENGSMGINCSNLVIAELTLSVSGGHGGDSAGYNIAGNKGGDGILCSSVFIDNSTVCITGGNGGNGHIGKAAPTMQSSENEKIHGSRGGEGGIGLRCQTLQLKGTSLTLQGGNGGAGGAGADGTEGAGKSGDGTNGGNGGDGGGALAVSEMPTESDSSVGYTAGKGGEGGKGGSKGTGWLGMQMGKDGEDGIAGNDGEEIQLI